MFRSCAVWNVLSGPGLFDRSVTQQIPRHSLERRRLAPRESYNYDSNNKRTYYVVPPGMNVIFRDEYGNELKRQVT